MSEQLHAIIAGAGIGGLTAALELARAGLTVSVFEKSPVIEEVGAGIQLAPNATRLLRDLDLLDRVQRQARIAPNHGETFGAGGESFLRLNFAAPRAQVAEAVQRLQTAFADLQ